MSNELSMLKRQNETTTQELTDTNQKILSRILKYVQISKIGAFDREIIRKDVIGMAMEAEKRGNTLSAIMDADEKSWCDSIVASYGKVSPSELILSMLKEMSILWLIWGVIFFNISPSIVKIDIGMLSLFLLYASVLVIYNFFVSSIFAFQSSIKQALIKWTILIITPLLMILILKAPKEIVLFSLPNYIIHLAFGITWVLSTVLYNNLIHKQAKKINWME